VLEPPWLRPNASVAGSFFCTGSVLVRTHNGAVAIVDFPVQGAGRIARWLHRRKETLPDARLAPALKTAVDRRPWPVALWQVTPRGARAHAPQDAVQDASMIRGWSTGLRLLRRQQRQQAHPLRVGQFVSVYHADPYTRSIQVCIHALALQVGLPQLGQAGPIL